MAVFVDIYGNEAREVIPASMFGLNGDVSGERSAKPTKKAARKTRKQLP